ncbi:glycosyltransferase family 61 protein [Halosolutus amylolyticus]|uniref:Glycosyltransferase family 61 protein n=1 Tax=Halosolutus amylolyticus TaxID=2932267 RepID=A0ABD5PMT8_9EURY|nr:glycosyltransferase family 61 protein [Halosolutus amylolyticus]
MSGVSKLASAVDLDALLSNASGTLGTKLSRVFHPQTYARYFHPASYAFVDYCAPLILDRDDLERRFRENGSIEYYDRDRIVEIEPPEGDQHGTEVEARIGTATLPQPFVGTLRDVRLVGEYPVPLDRRYRLVLEAVVSPEVLSLNMANSARSALSPSRPRTGGSGRADADTGSIDRAVLLYNQWNRGYYHWTVETLTRLEGVEAYRERTGETPKLIVGPNPTPFQRESLELLGYEDADLIEWDRHHGRVDELVVPSVRRELNRADISPVAHQWLHDRMCEAAAAEGFETDDDDPELVYISREDADYRRVVNEDEVLDVLEPYGFEKYVLSDRSMAEDVALFSRADVIVAPHGAGLTNVLYASDASVIELFRSDYVQPVYFVLAKQRGLRYRYQLCEYQGTDIVADVDALEAAVRAELEATDVIAG